jgi:hypothetical protein
MEEIDLELNLASSNSNILDRYSSIKTLTPINMLHVVMATLSASGQRVMRLADPVNFGLLDITSEKDTPGEEQSPRDFRTPAERQDGSEKASAGFPGRHTPCHRQ